MKIRLMSDLHTESRKKYPYIRMDEDVLVLAGDIGVGFGGLEWILNQVPMDLKKIYVPGNHEYYGHSFDNLNTRLAEKCALHNIHFLNNKSVVIDGVKFIGGAMWSDFLLFGISESWFAEKEAKNYIRDFQVITKTGRYYQEIPFTTHDCKEEFIKFSNFLKSELASPFEGDIVVVSHFCPGMESVHPKWANSEVTPYFSSNMSKYMGKPKLWLHGHTHDSHDYNIKGTRVCCNPLGYGNENKNGFEEFKVITI